MIYTGSTFYVAEMKYARKGKHAGELRERKKVYCSTLESSLIHLYDMVLNENIKIKANNEYEPTIRFLLDAIKETKAEFHKMIYPELNLKEVPMK